LYTENDVNNSGSSKEINSSNSEKSDKEDDLHLLKSNTIDKAKNILEKFSKNNSKEDEDEDEEDEDIENYLKNLENQKK
jgi:hypothetical protein